MEEVERKLSNLLCLKARLCDPCRVHLYTQHFSVGKSPDDSECPGAHLPVPAQLVPRVQHGGAGAAPQQLLQGLAVPAQAGAAQHAHGEAHAAGLGQRLQHGQRRGHIQRLTAQERLKTRRTVWI